MRSCNVTICKILSIEILPKKINFKTNNFKTNNFKQKSKKINSTKKNPRYTGDDYLRELVFTVNAHQNDLAEKHDFESDHWKALVEEAIKVSAVAHSGRNFDNYIYGRSPAETLLMSPKKPKNYRGI